MKDNGLLTVDDLCLAFPLGKAFNTVVNHISFEINPGEIVGLVGESGSGKSLTALSIMGLLPKNTHFVSGHIHYIPTNQHLNTLNKKAYEAIRGKEIGMIFQEPMSSLNPVLKCGFQIEEAIQNHYRINRTEAKKRCFDWMLKVGLQDLDRIYQSFPHQLSGGQKQRVMIAIALCCEPGLLIADEPTTALDVTVQKKILDLLLQLKNDLGIGILFITHDLAVVSEIADRLIVMQAGNIKETGEVHSIFTQPKDPYTQGLLACKPVLGKKYHRLPTIHSYLSDQKANVETTPIQKDKRNLDYNQVPLIKVDNLNVTYQKQNNWWRKKTEFQAVKAVSFEIFPGETLGLVGESGCGKSTLGKALAQLKSYTGSIKFKQNDKKE